MTQAFTKKPVPNTFEPVLVQGNFIVLDDDFDLSSMFYEMKDAEVIAE